MNDEILELREEIEIIDKELIRNLEKRFEICKKIGIAKIQEGMEVLDNQREKEIIQNKVEQSELNPEFIEKLFQDIFEESKRLQNES